MRRAAGFVVVALLVLAVALGALAWLIGAALGTGWGGGLAILGLVLVFGVIARFAIRSIRGAAMPLGDLIEASARVETGELGVQVPERGPSDVRALARSFNAMSARLAATEEQRRRLLADVSHELRTPLTVLLGNVEAMIDGVYPADRDHLEQVRDEAQHLGRLIEDLRTLSLADTGALSLNREPVDLADLARDVVSGFEAQASAAGVELMVEAPEPVELELDPQRVRQVVTNLVANGLRHTPARGRVTVSVRGDAQQATLAVSDTGAGMRHEDARRAFDRFWRSGDSAGAGLGLAIVRDLVAAHGGTAELASELGQGTTVTCTFPR
jgi:signal transduction histidine kinase